MMSTRMQYLFRYIFMVGLKAVCICFITIAYTIDWKSKIAAPYDVEETKKVCLNSGVA